MGTTFTTSTTSVDSLDSPAEADCYQSLKAPQLTNAQINLLRHIWTQTKTKGLSHVGNQVLDGSVTKSSEIAQILGKFNKKPEGIEDLPGDNHAEKFGQLIDLVVNSLDDLDAIEPILRNLGRTHNDFSSLGFHPGLWNVFSEVLIECTFDWGERHQKCPASQNAWVAVVFYIVDVMKAGYYDEFKKRRKSN